jgi:hypothetical protein
MDHYSTIKKNEIMLFAGKCMELVHYVERSKPGMEGQRLYGFPHMWKLGLEDACIL